MVANPPSDAEAGQPADEIDHDDLVRAIEEQSAVIVDVREPNEFAGGHIAVEAVLSRFAIAPDLSPLAALQPAIDH